MQTEIEVKFIDVDIDDVRQRLKSAGGELIQPMRDMRRALIEEEHHRQQLSFIRVRDEGDKVTLCFKRRARPDGESTIDSVQELETTVGDFDTTVQIFTEAGWEYTTYQESRRETWQLGEVEVVIDEWPWLKPYIEIEGPDEDSVRQVADQLGYDWNEAMFGSVDVIYSRKFPNRTVRGIIDIKEARFADPSPAEFGEYVEN